MSYTSTVDMFTIGIGPSSSHTLGPWRGAAHFAKELRHKNLFCHTTRIVVDLYGSLALTGKGHGTHFAIALGLLEKDPRTVALTEVQALAQAATFEVELTDQLAEPIIFSNKRDINHHNNRVLPKHSNGFTLSAMNQTEEIIFSATYYSIGGGFLLTDTVEQSDNNQTNNTSSSLLSNTLDSGKTLLAVCNTKGLRIAEVIRAAEVELHGAQKLNETLDDIFRVMLTSILTGCSSTGILPGGLNVKRRAPDLARYITNRRNFEDVEQLIDYIRAARLQFSDILKWIGCCAIAVNEENANYGRIVTAPTNGSAGVIPAVLMHLLCFESKQTDTTQIRDFLLTASAIGSLFKKGATISAAMGGCQAEIGVSSAMAAAALTESLGGTPAQALMAAEIAMEHHLGLTCDPIGGLVQIPCIERNSMGAIKAIMASQIALASDPTSAKVSLDDVIEVMRATAEDMSTKYKETSTGGLAVRIPLTLPEC